MRRGSSACEERGLILSLAGYGLPIARLYSQYFGGNLKLISMEGWVPPLARPCWDLANVSRSYGTDVYLHLSRLSQSSEPLQ